MSGKRTENQGLGWRAALRGILVLAVLALGSCGGGGGGGGGGSGDSLTLTLAPARQAVEIGGSVLFTASADAEWAVVEPGGGVVDPTGRYTAPLVPGTYHVRATAKADPAVVAEAEVTVRVGSQWLAYLNLFRSGARAVAPRRAARAGAFLPAVDEDPDLSAGALAHAKYVVSNDTSHPRYDPDGNIHDEDPSSPGYSPEGQAAARNGNVVKSEDPAMDSARAFDAWMTGPFHALGILDPRLERVGYGIWNEPDGRGWQSAAVLDVLSGLADQPPDGVSFPLFFPGPDAVVHLLEYPGLENPDPLSHTGCEGFDPPTGLPLIVQLGSDPLGVSTPDVTGARVEDGEGNPLEVCWFDESTYTNPDPETQERARRVLNTRDAVVIIPREPLAPGRAYTASITADGETYTWRFRTWPPPGAEYAVVPAPGTVLPGQTVSFRLVDAGGSPVPDVRWYVNGREGGDPETGTIAPDGTYTAPSAPSAPKVVSVRGESTSDPSAAAEVTFTVAAVTFEVAPLEVTLAPGESRTFTATVTVAPEGALPDTEVEFLVEGMVGGSAAVGTISPSGEYRAPQAPPPAGEVTVTARVKAVPRVSASASVVFRQPVEEAGTGVGGGATLSLAPAVSRVIPGAPVVFAVYAGADPVADPVRWLVNGLEGGDTAYGTITAGGVYTAPSSPPPDAVTVRAELVSDPSRFAEITFTVSAPASVSIAPSEATVPVDGRETFTVTTEPAGEPVVLLVNGIEGGDTRVGTIEPDPDTPGAYTYHAPPYIPVTGSEITIEARLADDSTVSASADVTLVDRPADISVSIAPRPQRVGLGARVSFAAAVTGAANTNVKWFVNGVEGGDPATGTISADGVYQAPPLMPAKPLTVTIRAQSVVDPRAFDEVAFPLMVLVADPGIIRSTQANSRHTVDLTAELSDGTALNLTNDPGIRASTDNPNVATATAGPASVTVGDKLGRTTVSFKDTATPGSPTAGVIVVSDTDYDFEVLPQRVMGAVEGTQRPVHAFLKPQRGPEAGGAYDLAPTGAVSYRALDGNGWVQSRANPVDPLPDPASYVAYVDADAGRVVFGRKAGVAEFEVRDRQTGKTATFRAEFLGLEVKPRIIKADGSDYESTNAGTVRVTPEGTQGFNETVFLILELSAVDSRGQAVTADTLAGLLEDTNPSFRVAAGQGDFIPPGLEALWYNGKDSGVTMADLPLVYLDGADRVAEVGVAAGTVTAPGLMPSSQIGGIVSIEDQAHVLADFVPRVPGNISVSLDLPGTVLLSKGSPIGTAVTFSVTGQLPVPSGVYTGRTVSDPAPAGNPFFANLEFSPPIYGVTPLVEYRLKGSSEDWQPAKVVTRAISTQVTGLGGGSGVSSQGIDGFVAAFSDPRSGTFEFRLRYAEFPGEVAAGFTGTVTLGPDGSNPESMWFAEAENSVQDFSEGVLRPVKICSTGPLSPRLHVGYAPERFTLYRPDGTTQADALQFSAVSGAESTGTHPDNPQIQIYARVAPGGCVEIQPQLRVPAEPGDVIHGEIGVWEIYPTGSTGGYVPVQVVFAGSSLVATPAVQIAPSGQSGPFQAVWRLKGGKAFAALLKGGTPTLTRVELRRAGKTVLYPAVGAVTPVDAHTLDVTLTVPEEYFSTGRGSFALHLFFGDSGEAHFKAGPLEIAEVAPRGPVPTVIPLNAQWPGINERGRVPVEVEVTGTALPVRVAAKVETPGVAKPLAGFGRRRERAPAGYRLVYTLRPITERWLLGGQSARFDLFGDPTDRTSTVDGNTQDLPDGLPDRVSASEGDTTLTIEVTQQGLNRTLLERSLTVFNFVARHGELRAADLAVKEGRLTREQAYAALAFEPNATTGEPAPPDPAADREVWIGVDHDPDKGLGVLDMAFFPGTPDDGRWADFRGEPDPFFPEEPAGRIVTGRARLSPFGLTLGGVCFDPWTFGRKLPNGVELLSFFPVAPETMLGNRLLYQQGGASGGGVTTTRYRLVARTPGADVPGLDCGYLRTGQVDDLGETIAEEAVRAGSAAEGRVITFSKDLDGRDVIRTALHLGGPNAAFLFTTDPTRADGQPLVEATIKAPLVLSRYPQRVRDDDVRLTTRVDAEAALKAASAKVVISVGAAAAGALLSMSGPAGVLAAAGVAAAFQILDNQAVNPQTGMSLPDHAWASTVVTAKGTPASILLQEGFEAVFPRVWERLTVNAVLDQDTGKALLYGADAFERIPVKKPFGVFTQASKGFRIKVVAGQASAGLIAGVLANVINDTIEPENYSANHSSHAYALEQVALVIPENAVVGDPQAGARAAWLVRVVRSDLDLRTARVLTRLGSRGWTPPVARVAGKDRSAPFYLRLKPAFGPLVIVAEPGGQTQAAPVDLAVASSELNTDPVNLVDFRVRVGGPDPTEFPFLSTTVVEAGRSSPQATARVFVDQSESELALRMVAPVIESISDGSNTWSAP